MTTELIPESFLTTCDREPIHQIGAIQGYGAFVAVSSRDFRIHHVSESFASLWHYPDSSESLLNAPLAAVAGKDMQKAVAAKLKDMQALGEEKGSFEWPMGETTMDVFLYKVEAETLALEFSPFPTKSGVHDGERHIGRFIQAMQLCNTVQDLGMTVCRAIRVLTGMDRVMIYRFSLPSWDGEVVAEDRPAHTHAFLHHRFPATDIPKPARDLYLRNKVRLIRDVTAQNSAILPSSRRPLDLSDSRLRAVSPVHLQYLRNMGVACSFSVAIVIEGRLWGLISCHNSAPLYVTHTVRAHCDTIANAFALAIRVAENSDDKDAHLSVKSGVEDILEKLRFSQDPVRDLFLSFQDVRTVYDVTGMAYLTENKVDFTGLTPPREELVAMGEWLREHMDRTGRDHLAIDSLLREDQRWLPLADHVSGALALRVSVPADGMVLFFRPEMVKTVQWGGDPRKNLEARNYAGPINPRQSFESWHETVRGSCKPWREFEVRAALLLKNVVFEGFARKERLIEEMSRRM